MEVVLAPVQITVKPIGTVRVTVAPTIRQISITPVERPITITPSVYQVTVSPVGVQGPPGRQGSGAGVMELRERSTPYVDADAPDLPPLYVRRDPTTGRVYLGRVT